MKLFHKFSICALALGLGMGALFGAKNSQNSVATKAEEEMTSTEVTINKIQLRGEGDPDKYFRILISFDAPWTNEGVTPNYGFNGNLDGDKTFENLNTLSKIHFCMTDGDLDLKDVINSGIYYQKLWGEDVWATERFKLSFTADSAKLVKVVIDAGCEFPKYGSTTEKYVTKYTYTASNYTGVPNGDGHFIFHKGEGANSKLFAWEKVGSAQVLSILDPADSVDGKGTFFLSVAGTDYADGDAAGYNQIVHHIQSNATNLSTNILMDGVPLASLGGTKPGNPNFFVFGCAPQNYNQYTIQKWARGGEHISFDLNGITDVRTISTYTIKAGTMLPSFETRSYSAVDGVCKYYEIEDTYVLTNNGDGTYNYRIVSVEGPNVTESAPREMHVSLFGDGNVWLTIELDGVNKANANIEPIDVYGFRRYLDTYGFGDRVLADGTALNTKWHKNFAVGNYDEDGWCLHFNMAKADFNAMHTIVIPEGMYFVNAAMVGKGAEGEKAGWVKTTRPVVAINRDGTWKMASIATTVARDGFVYAGNQTKNVDKDTTDFAFYLEGVAPELHTGETNAMDVRVSSDPTGAQIFDSAKFAEHVLIDGVQIPNVAGNNIAYNWWGRGRNFIGTSTTFAETKTTIETLTVKKGLYIPTSATVKGTEEKIIYVSADSTFNYKFVEGAKYQQIMTAAEFDTFLSDYIGTECEFASESDYDLTGKFANIWKYSKRVFSAMDAEQQSALVSASGAGLSKYDYVVAKYGMENFLGRTIATTNNMTVLASSSSLIYVVVAISLLTLAGAAILLRKKQVSAK